MTAPRQSLGAFYPRRYGIPVSIAGSAVLLVLGLSLPLLIVEKSVLWRHWKNTYSVFTGIVGLWDAGDHLLALIIFFFSIVFPVAKLTALWVIWAVRLDDRQRWDVLHWLEILGKWSMLDVFIVAIMVVAAKLKSLTTVDPQIGVFVFGLAIIASMLTTQHVARLTERTLPARSRSQRPPSPA
jgi:paraquat-inducible protein A